eukprot:2353497-Prymnesium_polylepis.1
MSISACCIPSPDMGVHRCLSRPSYSRWPVGIGACEQQPAPKAVSATSYARETPQPHTSSSLGLTHMCLVPSARNTQPGDGPHDFATGAGYVS